MANEPSIAHDLRNEAAVLEMNGAHGSAAAILEIAGRVEDLERKLKTWDRIEGSIRDSRGEIKLSGGIGGLSVSKGDPQKIGYSWHRRDDAEGIAEAIDWMLGRSEGTTEP